MLETALFWCGSERTAVNALRASGELGIIATAGLAKIEALVSIVPQRASLCDGCCQCDRSFAGQFDRAIVVEATRDETTFG
nr:hypothetical protein [Rhizobium gallicum]